MSKTDNKLLREFTLRGSQEAFRSLVATHIHVAHNTAMRRLQDTHLAQEVAQRVFLILARKARFLPKDLNLPGWIHRTAFLESGVVQRTERRRKIREHHILEASMISQCSPEENLLLDALDEALLLLKDKDRELLILRYLDQKSLRDVGRELGVSEDTAQKRVAKSLECLGAVLRQKGFSVPVATALAPLLSTSVEAVPTHLVSTIVQAAWKLATPGAISGIPLAITQLMTMTKIQTISLCLLAVLVPIGWQEVQTSSAARELPQHGVSLERDKLELKRREAELGRSVRQSELAAKHLKELQELDTRTKVVGRRLPNWSEQSQYVDIPKEALSQVELPAISTAKLETSPELKEILSITPGELEQIQISLNGFKERYLLVEGAHSTPTTNQVDLEGMKPRNRAGEVLGTSGERISFYITSFAAESAQVAESLQSDLRRILGVERAELYWIHAHRNLLERYRQMGERDRIVTWEKLDTRLHVYYEVQMYGDAGHLRPLGRRGNHYFEDFAPLVITRQIAALKDGRVE